MVKDPSPPGEPSASGLSRWEQLQAHALELAQGLGGSQDVTSASLQELLHREPVSRVDAALLQELPARLEALEPLPRLVLCLQLLDGLAGLKQGADGASLLARTAVTAIYELGRAELFPLRLELLDGLLATEPSPEESLAQRVARLEALLPQAEQTDMAGDLHDILAELEGRLLSAGQSERAAGAIHHARQAVALTSEPMVRASRLASLARLLNYGTPEEKASSLQFARQAVESLPSEAGDVHSVLAHAVLGAELLRHGQAAEALGHLEYALGLLARQKPGANRNLIRHQLAQALLGLGRLDDARHHLELVFDEAYSVGDQPALRDATLSLAHLYRRQSLDARPRLLKAEARLGGTPAQTLLALERLRPRLHAETPSEEFLEWARQYLAGQLPTDATTHEQLQAAVANHVSEIPSDIRRRLLQDGAGVIRDVVIRAQLLQAEGKSPEAVELLRSALAVSQQPEERLKAAALLIVLLPEGAHEERVRGCTEVEQLLESTRDSPYIRSDLASALWSSGRRDRGLLERAWRHAERAAGLLGNDPGAVEICTRVRARIRLDQVSLHAVEFAPSVRELAAWFTQALALPAKELSEYRCHVAWCLLSPGPVLHPEALALAEQLLKLVPLNEKVLGLRVRSRWLRACLASPLAPPPRPEAVPAEYHGPFDAVPGWAVALAQGQTPPSAAQLGPQERALALAMSEARPDRTAAVLEWLFKFDSDPRALDTLADQVAQSSPITELNGLLALAEKVAAEAPSFQLLRLRTVLCRRLAASGDRAPYTRAVDALVAFARTPEEQVGAKLIKGIERMEVEQIEAARQVLTEAIEDARRHQLVASEVFPLLVSAGNAFRKGDEPDLGRALALYSEAEALGAPGPHEAAKLWKVKAHALVDRGGAGDAAQALVLLDQALEVRRTGFLRVETLILTAEAEAALPGREQRVGFLRALDRLDEAERYAEGRYLLWVASNQCTLLARLVRLQPGDTRLLERLERLGQRHLELAEAVKQAKRGLTGPVPDDVMGAVKDLLRAPAFVTFARAKGLLTPPDLRMAEQVARRLGVEPARARQLLEQQVQREDRSPRGLRAYADTLARTNDPQERPGALVGCAILLAHVAAQGLAQREEVERVAHEAEQLLRRIPEAELRLRLLLELSHVWAPESHYNHPVRDFRRAAELAREVRNASRPGGELARSALQSLARATRYRTDGDLKAHLHEAELLYEQCVREYEAAGEHDVLEHVKTHLGELRGMRGAGNSLADLQEGITAARRRLEEGGSDAQMARARLTLAVNLTMWGAKQPPAHAEAPLSEAREIFESLDRSLLSPSDQHSLDNYRTICLADLAHNAGRHAEAIQLWRRRMESLGPEIPEEVWAYTRHNLADMLMGPGSNILEIVEGLRISEESLQVRTLERNPLHHWETCENIGRTIALLLLSPPGGVPFPSALSRTLWDQGLRTLRRALEATRVWGSHERLFQSAGALITLARSAPSVATLQSVAEEGWSALDEARPYLLSDDRAGIVEAGLGVEIAATLAHQLAERGLVGAADGFGFVLSGEQAEFVLRWMVRAAGSSQRRLAGRTARPESVPSATWVEWLAAIHSGESPRIRRALEALRQHAPLFLGGEPDLEGTWSWLRDRPGSTAVAVMGSAQGLLAAVLTQEEQRRVFIASLEVGAAPCDEATVAGSLTEDGPGSAYLSLLDWARRGVMTPLSRLLPRDVSRILWVPTGVLRALAPADLWPSVPVTSAVRLDLETRPSPPRPRRTLLAVADPGPDTSLSIPESVEMVARLARMVEKAGPLRVRMSRGASWGLALGVPCPELVEGPASPEELLRELGEVDVAMLLCHAEVEGLKAARLMLVDRSGALVPLEMERLAEDPRRVAGTTVVLLSCETGRVGDWLHQAAGLAGALLAGGARNVIAPLWPVYLFPALEVGNAVLLAMASRKELSVALQHLRAPEGEPEQGEQGEAPEAKARVWSLKGFVHWVG